VGVSSSKWRPLDALPHRIYRSGFTEFTREGISALGSLSLWGDSKFYLRVQSLPGFSRNPRSALFWIRLFVCSVGSVVAPRALHRVRRAPTPPVFIHLRSLLSARGWFFVWSFVVLFLSCRVLWCWSCRVVCCVVCLCFLCDLFLFYTLHPYCIAAACDLRPVPVGEFSLCAPTPPVFTRFTPTVSQLRVIRAQYPSEKPRCSEKPLVLHWQSATCPYPTGIHTLHPYGIAAACDPRAVPVGEASLFCQAVGSALGGGGGHAAGRRSRGAAGA